jgi:hypothetical protein
MPTVEKSDPQRALKELTRETLSALIGEQVLHTLGEPGNLLKIQVRNLWERYYRVNVFTGADAASATIGNSYFLEVDGEGHIVKATPKIAKLY